MANLPRPSHPLKELRDPSKRPAKPAFPINEPTHVTGFLLILFFCGLPSLFAFDPLANTVLPRGGQQGTEVSFTIIGDRLNDPEEIIFYRPGITASNLQLENSKRLTGIFHIAPDAALGEHPFRLRTKQGASYLRTFWVTSFAHVNEDVKYDRRGKRPQESNDTFEAPQLHRNQYYYSRHRPQGRRRLLSLLRQKGSAESPSKSSA